MHHRFCKVYTESVYLCRLKIYFYVKKHIYKLSLKAIKYHSRLVTQI